MINSLLSFGAKSVNPEILEQTLSNRRKVVNNIEKSCINKVKDSTTFQSLVIAPRGSGKTHVTKVLYHRFKNNTELTDKTVIAYMSEDEVGIANFTDLMVNILRAFVRYGEKGGEIIEPKINEASLIADVFKRENTIKNIVNDFAGNKIIILLIENFDRILNSLGKLGQGSLRDFIHQYNNLSIIATSQNLILSLQDSKMPFYNFFNVHQLKKLDYQETTEFLISIAKSEGNEELAESIQKPESEGNLRAIYELTEGNHRLLVTFFSFLKAEFKSELSDVFVKVMNDLKPYYEQFINALPPLQQKIVKHLALTRGASSGKEIARSCFIESKVFSKQMSLLVERGMIDKNKLGKDVFYELKEPLMRICFEIGENPHGISKLFVDFLSCYYDRQVIHKQYLKFKYGAMFQNEALKCKFENEALMYSLALNDSEKEKVSFEHPFLAKINDPAELYKKINFINSTNISDEHITKGNEFYEKGQIEKAIECYKKAIELEHENEIAILNMGNSFSRLKQYKKAIESYQKAIELNPKSENAYYNMGIAYRNMKEYEKAIESYQKVIELDPKSDSAYYNMGYSYNKMKEYINAIESYQKVLELNSKNDNIYNSLGLLYLKTNKIDEAFETLNAGLKINPDNLNTRFSLLGAYIRINDFNKSKELLTDLFPTADDKLLTVALSEDIFYNLFKFGSEAFIKMYFDFILKLILKEGKGKHLWNTLPESLIEILINIENYDKERLVNIENALLELLAGHEESIIPLRFFNVGVAFLKNNEKNAIYKLSKEERKIFKEAILDKREL